MLWVLICSVHLTIYSCHVTYAFQSKSTLYSCLNVKELLARSRCKIWSLSDCNWTRTHNHLVHKRTLNHLATCLFSVVNNASASASKTKQWLTRKYEIRLSIEKCRLTQILLNKRKMLFFQKKEKSSWYSSFLILQQFTNWTRHNSKRFWFNVRL